MYRIVKHPGNLKILRILIQTKLSRKSLCNRPAPCCMPWNGSAAVEFDDAAGAAPFAGHHEVEVFAGIGPHAVAGAM